MSSESEKIFTEIVKKQQKNNSSLMDSIIEFCTENDIEPEDLIKKLDPHIHEIIKQNAISENMIQKKHIQRKNFELPFK